MDCCLRSHNTPHRTAEAYNIQFPRIVLAERGNQIRTEQQGLHAVMEHEYLSGAKVTIDVRALWECCLRAAINVAAGDGAAARRVRVFRNRRGEAWRGARCRAQTRT